MRDFLSRLGREREDFPKKEDIPSPCPYCGELLPKKPTRKRKCPYCKKVIYVRTDPETREKVVTTEKGAQKIHARKKRIAYRNRWLRSLASYGIGEQDFVAEKARLGKQFGKEPPDADIIWGLFNSLVERQPSTSPYYEMALFLEEEKRDFIPILQQSRKLDLLPWKEAGMEKVKIHAADQACPSCKSLQGQVFTIDAALKEMPIPNRECTTHWHHPTQGFCRCVYLASFDD